MISRRLIAYGSGMVRWLGLSGYVSAGLSLLVVAAVLCILLPDRLVDALRYLGVGLELLGILIVGVGLRGRRLLFGKPSFAHRLQDWRLHRPRWSKDARATIVGVVAITDADDAVRATGWIGTGPDSSVEARFTAVEANFQSLRDSHARDIEDLHRADHIAMQSVANEAATRAAAHDAIESRLEELGAGSLGVEALGLTLLALGVILATVPDEIASLLLLL